MIKLSDLILVSWISSGSYLGFTHPITVGIIALPLLTYHATRALFSANERNVDPINPETTLFAFDLHGVLFNVNYLNALSVIFKSNHAGTIMRSALHPRIIYDTVRFYNADIIYEQIIMSLAHKYERLKPCIPTLLAAANQVDPSWQTIEIVRTLHEQGYTVHLFSNIGPQLYADLENKYPEIFDLFDAIQIGSRTNGYRGKPHPSYYYLYIVSHPSLGKQRILIDDWAGNIINARLFELKGIRFANPKQLHTWLLRHHALA